MFFVDFELNFNHSNSSILRGKYPYNTIYKNLNFER